VISGLGIRFEFLLNTLALVVVGLLGAKVSWWMGERSMQGVSGDGGREE
jgi:hypothetical protein